MPTASDLAQQGNERHRELTCACCGKEFIGSATHAECMEEAEDYFGEGVGTEELAVVCDECWQRIKPGAAVLQDGTLRPAPESPARDSLPTPPR